MTVLSKIIKVLAWIFAALFAGLLLLALYAPGMLDKLMQGLNLDTGAQPPIIWVAFVLGLVIVLAGLGGSWKGSRKRSQTQRPDGQDG